MLSLFISLSPSCASRTVSANYLTWFSFSCPMSSFIPGSFSLGILIRIANLGGEANKGTGTILDPSVRRKLHFICITRFMYFVLLFLEEEAIPCSHLD